MTPLHACPVKELLPPVNVRLPLVCPVVATSRVHVKVQLKDAEQAPLT